jgi:hypothetical protein
MALYTNVFKQSLKTTFHNKYLWLFGFFATLFGGSIELDLFNGILQKTNVFVQGGILTNSGLFGSQLFSNLKLAAFSSDVIIIIFFFLCLAIAVILVAIISQVGIINNTAGFVERDERVGLKVGIKAGMNHFWPVVVLDILAKIVVAVLLGIAFLPLVKTMDVSTFGSNALFIVLFLVVVLLVISMAFIVKYISGYIVIYSQRFRDAVGSGWKLFRQNWLVSVEMGFMLLFINVFISFAVVMLISVVAIPLALLTSFTMAYLSVQSFVIMYWLRFVIALLIFVAGGAMLTSFNISAWTILFLRLNKGGAESKIMRIVSKF